MKSAAKSAAPAAASARFPYSPEFLALAIEFADKAASGFGYAPREVGGLVLGVEEIFGFYAGQAAPGSAIELTLQDFGWQLQLTLSLQLAHPDLHAFNLTYRVDPDDPQSLAGLGPMIAARSVTRLRLESGAGERLALQLIRERDYPPAALIEIPANQASGMLRLAPPTGDDMRHFAALASASGAAFVPNFLTHPDMAADMLDAGALGALLAQDGPSMQGGVVWRRLNDAAIELFGPYLFYPDRDDQLLTQLLDDALARISRSGARLLVRRQGKLAQHERFFDFLGELTLTAANGETIVWPHYYRQLREESGSAVYAEPRFAEFLNAQYERLCLPRQVRQAQAKAIPRDGSLLSVEFEHGRSLATLRPLSAGADIAENLRAHLALLQNEGIRNAIVEIDTGRADDTTFTPALFDAGFAPRLLIPDAGRGDLVLFMR